MFLYSLIDLTRAKSTLTFITKFLKCSLLTGVTEYLRQIVFLFGTFLILNRKPFGLQIF